MGDDAGSPVLDYALINADHDAFTLWLMQATGARDKAVKDGRVAAGIAVAVVLGGLALAFAPSDGSAVPTRQAVGVGLLFAIAGLLLGWAVSRPAVTAAVDALQRRRLRPHLVDTEDAYSWRRAWLEPSGFNIQTAAITTHWDWAAIKAVEGTPDHWIISFQYQRAAVGTIIPRRFGPNADRLAELIRAGLAAPAPAATPPPPRAEGVNFVLTISEQLERTTWDASRGVYDSLLRERRFRELAPALLLVPVVVVLWLPAWAGYEWTALLPALLVTGGALAAATWGWFTAPQRELALRLEQTERAGESDPTYERGPTSVWLDRYGVNVRHVARSYHYAWDRISELTESSRLVMFAADGRAVALPRRVDPQRVAWLAAALRAPVEDNQRNPQWRRPSPQFIP